MAYLERDASRGNIKVGLIDELADRLDELLEQAALLEAGFEHGDCPRAQLGSAVCTLGTLAHAQRGGVQHLLPLALRRRRGGGA